MAFTDDSSNDSSNNNSNNGTYENDEKTQERALFHRFVVVTRQNLYKLLELAERGEARLGEEEGKWVRSITTKGATEGTVAGIISFLLLRRGPVYIAKWVASNRQIRLRHQPFQSQHTTTPPPPPPGPTGGGFQLANPNTSNPFHRANNPHFPRPGNFMLRAVWLMADAVLSVMVGTSITMMYKMSEESRREIEELPLLPGVSMLPTITCGDIITELHKVQQEAEKGENPAYIRLREDKKNPASKHLESIIKYAQNCQRRHFVERQIRRDKGEDELVPSSMLQDGINVASMVEIPPPGVSRMGPRLISYKDDAGKVVEAVIQDGASDGAKILGGFQLDESWANQFVSDQVERSRGQADGR